MYRNIMSIRDDRGRWDPQAARQPVTRRHPARDPMGGGRGECTGAHARHDLWGARRVGLLALALALSLSTFRRHRLCIITVATIVGHSRVTAANSLGDDLVGSLHPPTASVAARDAGGLGNEGDAALEASNAQQRYPPAHIELQKGIDLYVRIFYLCSMHWFVEIISLRPSDPTHTNTMSRIIAVATGGLLSCSPGTRLHGLLRLSAKWRARR